MIKSKFSICLILAGSLVLASCGNVKKQDNTAANTGADGSIFVGTSIVRESDRAMAAGEDVDRKEETAPEIAQETPVETETPDSNPAGTGGASNAATPTPKPAAPTPTPTATPTPTSTSEPTATPPPASTPKPTATAKPTATPTPNPTVPPTPAPVHTHNFLGGNCSVPATCSCGATGNYGSHNWVTEMVHHDAAGHYESRVVGTETVVTGYTPRIYYCSTCQTGFSSLGEWDAHLSSGNNRTHYLDFLGNEPIYGEKEITENVWVEDSAAWDETVTTCSICGAPR